MFYTKIKVNWEHCKSPVADTWGDIVRDAPIKIVARKQSKQQVIKSSNGQELLSKSIYYVDPKAEPNAMKISKLDKLDGETVEDVYVMCDLYNKPKLLRFITI
jgi:hypothetical protein